MTTKKSIKQMSIRSIRSHTLHDAFIWMIYAACKYSTFSLYDVIFKYWEYAFKNKTLTGEDFNKTVFDRIRRQLLINGGITKPILNESIIVSKIRQSTIFTKE